MFRRGVESKSDKVSLRRTKMKETMRIYLSEVSDIGSRKMIQR